MDKKCIVSGIMKTLSKKWMLLILQELGNSPKRFNQLIKGAAGISSRTLSKRLKELKKIGIVKRQVFNEIPPKVEYSLTKSGKELVKGFYYIDKWVKKWNLISK